MQEVISWCFQSCSRVRRIINGLVNTSSRALTMPNSIYLITDLLKRIECFIERIITGAYTLKHIFLLRKYGRSERSEHVFWKKCKHEWHYLTDDFITSSYGGSVEADRACWIFCTNCEKEELVYRGKWERIKRKQEIMKERSEVKI